MKLVALKKLRYPRGGPDGKEYEEGQEFETLSDRDAKAYLLVRAAKKAPEPVEDEVEPARMAKRTVDPLDHDEDGRKGGTRPAPRRYNRRDLKAEE